MGAWGPEPWANDTALDWIANTMRPVIDEIERGLDNYLEDGRNQFECVASIQLLLALTPYATDSPQNPLEQAPIGLHYEAEQRALYTKSNAAVQKLLKDTGWLRGWKTPEESIVEIYQRLSQQLLQRATHETASGQSNVHECQDCRKLWTLTSVLHHEDPFQIPNLNQRVQPGERMPSGVCPDCGALCTPATPKFTDDEE